jgi:hypothetical protein
VLVEVDDRACGRDLLRESERALHDPALLLDGTRRAEVVPHREVHEQCPWGLDLDRQISSRRHDHGRDAGRFDHSCDQTHGLVIEWSGGNQQEEVDLVVVQFACQCRRRLLLHPRAAVDAAHEPAPVPAGDRADDSLDL